MARPRTVLVKKFEKHIEGNLGITVEDTRSPEHAAFVDKLLDLLHWDEALLSSRVELRRPELAKAKLNALIRDLKSFLHGRLDGKRWVHVCTFGCCEGGVEESRARLVELISLVFLHRIPNVPALNKWTQLYPSISWWAVAMQLHKFIQMIWAKTFPGCGDRDDPVLDLFGPGGRRDTEWLEQGQGWQSHAMGMASKDTSGASSCVHIAQSGIVLHGLLVQAGGRERAAQHNSPPQEPERVPQGCQFLDSPLAQHRRRFLARVSLRRSRRVEAPTCA